MPSRLWPLAAAAATAFVGLVVLVVGLLVATVGAPSAVETLTVRPADGASSVVTAPGVLELLADKVEVRAQAPAGGRVVLAVARAQDAAAYLGKSAAIEVTGRDGEGAAATRSVGSSTEALTDPTTVDIWADVSAPGAEATLAWTARPGRWVLVAATVPASGGASAGRVAAPESVSLSWRPVRGASPAVPLVAIGLLLLVAGGVAAGVIVVQRRSPVGEEEDEEPGAADAEQALVPTGPLTSELPVVPAGAVPSSRRAARAAREAAEAAGRRSQRAVRPQADTPAPVDAVTPPPPADPPTTVLSLGRHRTSDLFSAQPLPGRRATRGADGEAARDGTGEGESAEGSGTPGGDGSQQPTPAFRFRGEAATEEGQTP